MQIWGGGGPSFWTVLTMQGREFNHLIAYCDDNDVDDLGALRRFERTVQRMHEFLPHTLLTLKMRTGWFDAKDKWSATSFVKTAQRLEYAIQHAYSDKSGCIFFHHALSRVLFDSECLYCAGVSTW